MEKTTIFCLDEKKIYMVVENRYYNDTVHPMKAFQKEEKAKDYCRELNSFLDEHDRNEIEYTIWEAEMEE